MRGREEGCQKESFAKIGGERWTVIGPIRESKGTRPPTRGEPKRAG
jgi:hypothetical protein